MAIKIIQAPLAPNAVKRTICDNCGATLEYTRSDTRTITKRDYTGDADTYRVLDCPNCKEQLTVGFA